MLTASISLFGQTISTLSDIVNAFNMDLHMNNPQIRFYYKVHTGGEKVSKQAKEPNIGN